MAAHEEIFHKILRCILLIFILKTNQILIHTSKASKPNIVILFADDLGYGDLEIYGHPTSSSPNLNKLAANGLRFTQFYVTSPVCSPSRASLLTARYQVRSGIYPGVFEDKNVGGLPLNETTIAEMLKPNGYKSAIIGKWHLGVGKNKMYLPTNQGFDHYYGIPFSHDMCYCPICFYPDDRCFDTCHSKKTSARCAIFNDTTIVEQPADMTTVTEKYVQEATKWVSEHAQRKEPFFLYFPFHHTHHPQFASKMFRNATARGTFGDSLAELDWAVGEVMKQLETSGVINNTFVFFTADNGPSLVQQVRGGNAGLLKCGKGTTYEGGQRVPALAHWPGRIAPGQRTLDLASSLDLLPTIASITGSTIPNVTLDGVDMSNILFNNQPSKRDVFYYYSVSPNKKRGAWAVRYKQYKAHFYTEGSALSGGLKAHDEDCRPGNMKTHNPPLLYDLNLDPSEQYDLSKDSQYRGLIEKIMLLKKDFDSDMSWAKSQTARPAHDKHKLIPCCSPSCTPFPSCCSCKQQQSSLQEFLNHIHHYKT